MTLRLLNLSFFLRLFLYTFIFFSLAWVNTFAQTSNTIAEIQGLSDRTNLLNDQVTINNAVVTASHRDLLFVQSIDEDGNPNTSEGIMLSLIHI